MNRIGPKGGHSDVLQTSNKAKRGEQTTEKGLHNGQEVSYTEVPASQSKVHDKACALNRMPDLEQRQIDKLEQEINLLRSVVEAPDTRPSPSRKSLEKPGVHELQPDTRATQSSHAPARHSEVDVAADHSQPLHKTSTEASQPLAYQSKSSAFSSLISKIAKKIVASTGYLMDKKELEESKKIKKAAKKQYEKARNLCVDTEKKIKTLEDKIKKLENGSGQLKLFKASRTRELQEKKSSAEKRVGRRATGTP
ncbi:hypothetical protein [Endozoicomonas lisbonensis]|uniref:hypothetical protein n=1 Tax=Endozoicomonas lisbonensis TaxID=3120522 RepID=UPI003396DE9C